jgi:hypothetical protein
MGMRTDPKDRENGADVERNRKIDKHLNEINFEARKLANSTSRILARTLTTIQNTTNIPTSDPTYSLIMP